MFLLKLLIHLLFIIPIFYGKYFYSVAIALLIASAYIKTKKYDQLLLAKNLSKKERESYERTRNFWKAFTFLQ